MYTIISIFNYNYFQSTCMHNDIQFFSQLFNFFTWNSVNVLNSGEIIYYGFSSLLRSTIVTFYCYNCKAKRCIFIRKKLALPYGKNIRISRFTGKHVCVNLWLVFLSGLQKGVSFFVFNFNVLFSQNSVIYDWPIDLFVQIYMGVFLINTHGHQVCKI